MYIAIVLPKLDDPMLASIPYPSPNASSIQRAVVLHDDTYGYATAFDRLLLLLWFLYLHVLLRLARISGLTSVLHLLLMLLTRIATSIVGHVAHGIGTLVVRLSVILVLGLMLRVLEVWHRVDVISLEVDVHPARVCLCSIL